MKHEMQGDSRRKKTGTANNKLIPGTGAWGVGNLENVEIKKWEGTEKLVQKKKKKERKKRKIQ